MNDACYIDFCQTMEKMLAELGFELTTAGLTPRVATDCSTGGKEKDVEITFPELVW